MNNYIKIYEEYFNIEIPLGFDIHHINLDHSDNRIENLLMLPETTHTNYHELRPKVENLTIEIEILSINESGNKVNNHSYDCFNRFMPVYIECCKWKDYKEFLLGNIPNIHNIQL